MYQKIADRVNDYFGYDSNGQMSAEDVENYLRFGNTAYVDAEEAEYIEQVLEDCL